MALGSAINYLSNPTTKNKKNSLFGGIVPGEGNPAGGYVPFYQDTKSNPFGMTGLHDFSRQTPGMSNEATRTLLGENIAPSTGRMDVWNTIPSQQINPNQPGTVNSSFLQSSEEPIITPKASGQVSTSMLSNEPIITPDKPGQVNTNVIFKEPEIIPDPSKEVKTSEVVDDKNINKEDVEPDDFEYDTETGDAYKTAIDAILQGLSGGGTKETQAAILGGREALASARRGAEAQAGGLAAATGAIGQGTALSYAEQVRRESLQQLAQQELGFTQLRSQEQSAMIDKIIQAEQAEKSADIQAERVDLERRGQNITIEQLNRQFDQLDAELREKIATRIQQGEQFNITQMNEMERFNATLKMTESQWTDKFGLEQSQIYTNNLLELSLDNPVLANKVTNYLLAGETGAVGEFTQEEKDEMTKLADEARLQEGKVDNVFDLVLANLEQEYTGGTGIGTISGEEGQASIGAVAGTTATTTYNGTPINQLSDIQWEELLSDEKAIQQLYNTKDEDGNPILRNLTLNPQMVFRAGDFQKLGLKADEAYDMQTWSRLEDTPQQLFGQPETITNNLDSLTAGEGNGSVIIHNGTPYRIVKYITTKKVRTGKDQRATEVIGLNLLTGQEESITSSGWVKI